MLPAIIACEIGFWVLLVLGLATRYGLRRPRAASVLLWGVPLIDLVLLVLIVTDLRHGATADWSHGLGALYLGTSVVFGPAMIRWLDAKFARRFTSTPRPVAPGRYGWDKARLEWAEFAKAVLAGAISAAVLAGCIAAVEDPSRTAELTAWFPRIGLVLGIWAITPISYTLWPKHPPATAR